MVLYRLFARGGGGGHAPQGGTSVDLVCVVHTGHGARARFGDIDTTRRAVSNGPGVSATWTVKGMISWGFICIRFCTLRLRVSSSGGYVPTNGP